MKKRWDDLIEDMSGRHKHLRAKALQTGVDKDWDSYEGALIRDGEITTALRRLASAATMENLASIRRVMDKVKPIQGKELMATGTVLGKPATFLVMEVTGSSIRVRERISMSLMGSRWVSMPKLLDKKTGAGLRFHIADMRPEDMPKEYGKKTVTPE